jgi:hypothetical protein
MSITLGFFIVSELLILLLFVCVVYINVKKYRMDNQEKLAA